VASRCPLSELQRRSGVAIRLALQAGRPARDRDARDQLERYVAEITDEADLDELHVAATTLGDAIMSELGRRHSYLA
jgi:hypothetical protein